MKTKKDVFSTLDKYYYITDNGVNIIGRYDDTRNRLFSDHSVARILSAYDFILENFVFRKTKYNGFNSYFLKHLLEDIQDDYISNGQLIIAFLLTDCLYTFQGNGGPNMFFAITEKSVDKLKEIRNNT